MFQKKGEAVEEKGFFARHKLWMAITTLIGTIVGAGILGIPYVVAKAGFVVGLIFIILLGLAFLYLNLFTGEIVLRTKEQHQLTGYAEKYLGRWGKRVMTFTMLFSIYGALTAYLIGEGESLRAIFRVGSPLFYTLIFFIIGFLIVWRGVKATGKAELFLILFLFVVVVLISIFSYRQLDFSHLTTFNLGYILLPYGVILFSLLGSPAIPEMQEVLGKDKKLMKRAIIIGSLIPILLYIVFTAVIMGLVGIEQFELLQPNERIATIALSVYAHPLLGIFANVLAVLSMFTSFLALSIALTEVYEYDYKMTRSASLLLTFSLPLVIAVFNLATFLRVLDITGAVAGGLNGVLIILLYWQAKKYGDRDPEYSLGKHALLGAVLMFFFIVGILYQLWASFA